MENEKHVSEIEPQADEAIEFLTLDAAKREKDRRNRGTVAWALGLLVYLGALTFGLFMVLSIFGKAFEHNPNLQWVGYLAIGALALNAIALPLFIHYHASGTQHTIAILLYAFDLFVYAMNGDLGFRVLLGEQLEGFWAWYFWNMISITPTIAMAGWAVLIILDPAFKILRAEIEADGELAEKYAAGMGLMVGSQDVHRILTDGSRKRVNRMARKFGGVNTSAPKEEPAQTRGIMTRLLELLEKKNEPPKPDAPKAEPAKPEPSVEPNGNGAGPKS